TRTARRRIAVLALAGIVLAAAAVVTVALGHAGRHSAVASPIAELADPSSRNVNSVAFSPDARTLAAADENGSTYLWAVATRTRIATLTGPHGSQAMMSVAFSPDGKTLATANADASTYLWDVATRTRMATLSDPGGEVTNSVAFSPDGKTL